MVDKLCYYSLFCFVVIKWEDSYFFFLLSFLDDRFCEIFMCCDNIKVEFLVEYDIKVENDELEMSEDIDFSEMGYDFFSMVD